ncbi:MAG: hypothetical protein NTV68_14375 [Methanomicrobiales archaeon]|nr:hypothetical protein [Methanomicrobiales archaeon]
MNSERTGQNCSSPDPGSSPATKTGMRGYVLFLISCCPFTMLGKKIVQFLRGDIGTHLPQSNREIYLQSKVKIGFGIILIGASCPVFWFSFLSGARGIALLFSSVSSLIVIVFGLTYMGFYRIQLRNELGTGKIPGTENANE